MKGLGRKLIKKNNKVAIKEEKAKKWTGKKIVAVSVIGAAAVAFVAFVVIVAVMGLGSIRPIKSTEQEATVVGECGGFEVRYEELRYITLIHKQSLDAKYGSYAELGAQERAEYDTELEALVLEDIKSNYVILSLCEKYGVEIDSKEAKSYVNDELEAFVEEELDGSRKKYKEWLAENGLTDSFLRLMYKVDYLEGVLLDKFVDDKIGVEYDVTTKAEFVEYVLTSEDYVKTIHAYYPKKSDAVDTHDMEEKANKARDELLAQSSDKGRYSLMKTIIGKAPFVPGYSVTGTDYYFTHGQMGEQYEEIAFSLDIYEVGELLETEDGYYVIMRVPLVEDEIRMTVDTLLSQYQYAVLKRAENEQMGKIAFDGNEYFDGLALSEIK